MQTDDLKATHDHLATEKVKLERNKYFETWEPCVRKLNFIGVRHWKHYIYRQFVSAC